MATLNELQYGYSGDVDANKVGTIESILSGVASGLIAIPKGFFSLGATLMDLGVNSGKAARVEAFLMTLQSSMKKHKLQQLEELQKR